MALDLLPCGSEVDSATFAKKTLLMTNASQHRLLEAMFKEILCLPKKKSVKELIGKQMDALAREFHQTQQYESQRRD